MKRSLRSACTQRNNRSSNDAAKEFAEGFELSCYSAKNSAEESSSSVRSEDPQTEGSVLTETSPDDQIVGEENANDECRQLRELACSLKMNGNAALVESVISHLTAVVSGDKEYLNFIIWVIQGLEGRDPAEIMLMIQMVVVHLATIRHAKRLTASQNLQQTIAFESGLNKFGRTFVVLMEGLKNFRSGDKQQSGPQNVSVNGSSQTIVGNVTQKTVIRPNKKRQKGQT